MKLVPESSSSWKHIASAIYCWASLLAWSEDPELSEQERKALAEAAASLRSYIDALIKEARETQDKVLFERPLAQARQNAMLFLLKRKVASVLSTLVDRVGRGSKDHPLVREFLPRLLGGVTGAPLTERPALVRQAAARLASSQAALPEKDALAEGLRSAATAAQTAVSAADQAWSAWTVERSEEVVAKGRLRMELERVHGTLRTLFPGQRDFVESFFLKGERPSEGSDEPAGAAEDGGGEG